MPHSLLGPVADAHFCIANWLIFGFGGGSSGFEIFLGSPLGSNWQEPISR